MRERVRAEQVRVIYQQAPPALLISVLVAAVLCFVLRDVADHARLKTWFSVVAMVALVRIALVRAFRRKDPQVGETRAWELAFLVSLGATGLAWGVGGWLLMPPRSLFHQAVLYFFLMGMAGGGVASYSAHAACSYVTIGTVLLPATAFFVVQEEPALRAMAVGGLVYVGAAYRATRTLSFFLHRNFELSSQLQIAHDAAQKQARTDELTAMKNRRAFYEHGQSAVEQARRYARPLSLVMLDIDHFKQINDTRGHRAGDEAIRAVAAVITGSARAADIAGRVGGEEFAIILPETAVLDAAAQAERLRREIAALKVRHEGNDITVTASLGVAELSGEGGSLDSLVGRADAALYEAKAQGRNRVVCRGG